MREQGFGKVSMSDALEECLAEGLSSHQRNTALETQYNAMARKVVCVAETLASHIAAVKAEGLVDGVDVAEHWNAIEPLQRQQALWVARAAPRRRHCEDARVGAHNGRIISPSETSRMQAALEVASVAWHGLMWVFSIAAITVFVLTVTGKLTLPERLPSRRWKVALAYWLRCCSRASFCQ